MVISCEPELMKSDSLINSLLTGLLRTDNNYREIILRIILGYWR